jgi:hypothetical protein
MHVSRDEVPYFVASSAIGVRRDLVSHHILGLNGWKCIGAPPLLGPWVHYGGEEGLA